MINLLTENLDILNLFCPFTKDYYLLNKIGPMTDDFNLIKSIGSNLLRLKYINLNGLYAEDIYLLYSAGLKA